MKRKVLTLSLTAIILFSSLNLASAAVKCPRCHGTGEITEDQPCPICGGDYEANIIRKRIMAGNNGTKARPATSVSGVFHNELADVGVYGVATAEVKSATATYTNTSAETYFPPGEDVTVTVIVEGIEYAPHLSCYIYISAVGDTDCPECGGTGIVTATEECPDCGGTGFVAALPGDENSSLLIGGVAVGVAAALVIAAVLVVKRKRVTEESLRRLPPSEFQNWVIKKLAGKPPSPTDSRIGIDGYTTEGQPISIKQSDGVGRDVIDKFASAIGQSKAKNGILVAYSFGNDAYTAKVKAKLNYGLEIQMVTVKDLIESKKRPL